MARLPCRAGAFGGWRLMHVCSDQTPVLMAVDSDRCGHLGRSGTVKQPEGSRSRSASIAGSLLESAVTESTTDDLRCYVPSKATTLSPGRGTTHLRGH